METPNLCPKRLASFAAVMLLALSSPQTMRAQEALYPHHFNLHEVTLLNGPLKTAQDLNFKTLLDYDADRFHLSHMKKVVDWYNCLREHASLDFVTDEDREKEAEEK